MPVISQEGMFSVGDFGGFVECHLTPLETNKLAGVTGVTLELTRPDGTMVTRALPVPGCIIDVNGKIEFAVLNGDLTLGDIYMIKLIIAFGASPVLNVSGDFEVNEEDE